MKHNTGSYVIKGVDEVVVLLDDQIVKVQGMRGSPYAKGVYVCICDVCMYLHVCILTKHVCLYRAPREHGIGMEYPSHAHAGILTYADV